MPHLVKKVLYGWCESPGVRRLPSFLATPLFIHKISVTEKCSGISYPAACKVRGLVGCRGESPGTLFANAAGFANTPFPMTFGSSCISFPYTASTSCTPLSHCEHSFFHFAVWQDLVWLCTGNKTHWSQKKVGLQCAVLTQSPRWISWKFESVWSIRGQQLSRHLRRANVCLLNANYWLTSLSLTFFEPVDRTLLTYCLYKS